MTIEKLQHVADLIRLKRPIGFFLLLWPSLATLLVLGETDIKIYVIFTIGAWLMRSAGCAANDLADRKFDSFVERTKNRPLAVGHLKPIDAVTVIILLLFGALALVLLLNSKALYASFIGLGLALAYPLTKRFFIFPQAFLGLAFAWPVPMAFAATNSPINSLLWQLFAIAFLLPLAYDTLYAMADAKDDAHLPIYSSVKTLGSAAMPFVLLTELLLLVLMFALADYLAKPWVYKIGLAGLSVGLGLIHWLLKKMYMQPFTAFRAYGWGLFLWVVLLIFSQASPI